MGLFKSRIYKNRGPAIFDASQQGHNREVKREIPIWGDYKDYDGLTPLHCAVDHPKTVKLLLENGADVNAKMVHGLTPLHFAVTAGFLSTGNAKTVKLLLENGADVNARDEWGRTPLEDYKESNPWRTKKKITKLLLQQQPKNKQHPQGGGCPEGYMETELPVGTTDRCSDQECPCPPPGTVIPRGKGYIYISQEVADFRRDCPTMKQATEKIKRMENSMGASIVISGPGVVVPILMCKQGAKKRGLDLKVAQEDARSWWETGLVPLRATPMAR